MKKIFALSLWLIGISSYAQITFDQNILLEFFQEGAMSGDIVDLDSDGDLDVIGSSFSYEETFLVWFENDGSQNFAPHVIKYETDVVYSLDHGDFDADGNMDFIAGTSLGLFLFENDGNQNFQKRVIDDSSQYFSGAIAGDLDQDGDLDILATDYDANKLIWYENNGSGQLQEYVIDDYALAATDVSMADVDLDGDYDILSTSNSGFMWYENDGEQNFNYRQIHNSSEHSQGANSIRSLDLDQDGDMDVVGSAYNSDSFSWFENDGNQNFSAHYIFKASGFENDRFAKDPKFIGFGDFDKDGDIDIAGAAQGSNSFSWFENNGLQQFEPHNLNYNSGGPEMILVEDIDRDGDLDLFTIAGSSDDFSWNENDGNGNFTHHYLDENSRFARDASGISSVDIDGDGDMDILTCAGKEKVYTWFENKGNLNYIPHVICDLKLYAEDAADVDWADIDGDGDPDVIGAARSQSIFAWFENDGIGNFTPRVIYDRKPHAWGAMDIDKVDLDNDGDIDILGASYSSGLYAWFENDGDGNFTPHIINDDPEFSNTAVNVDHGDLDGDGDIDIVGASFYADAFVWFENDGQQNFNPHVLENDPEFADSARRIIAVDIDSDGDLDAIGSNFSKTFQLFNNDGSGNFTREVPFTSDNGRIENVISVDLDEDGDIDLICSRELTNNFWLENDGSGGFTKHEMDAPGSLIEAMTDLDNDGDLDALAVGNNEFIFFLSNYSETGTPGENPEVPELPEGPQEPEILTEFTISPNPANLEISFSQLVDDSIKKIDIYNLNGAKVGTYNNFNEETLDISGFPSGFYFFIFTTDQGNRIVKKMIIK